LIILTVGLLGLPRAMPVGGKNRSSGKDGFAAQKLLIYYVVGGGETIEDYVAV
jgi:hypothetical protein